MARVLPPTSDPSHRPSASLFSISRPFRRRLRDTLSLESEVRTHLVGRLLHVLSVERSAETNGDAGAQLGVVCEGRNAAVVDFTLQKDMVSTGTCPDTTLPLSDSMHLP